MAETVYANGELEASLRQMYLLGQKKSRGLDDIRSEVVEQLNERFGPSKTNELVESFEAAWQPAFGGQVWGAGRGQHRQTYEAAMRENVGPDLFARYVASLREFRETEANTARMHENIYKMGGFDVVDRVANETETLKILQDEVSAIAKKMNPNISIKAEQALIGNKDQDQGYDPLRRTVAVSLDPMSLDVKQQAYRELWGSVEHLLDARERKILDERFGASPEDYNALSDEDKKKHNQRLEKAAKEFAKWASPDGARKPDTALSRAFKPIGRFFERVNNKSRGLGFQTVEDIYAKAAKGKVADREDKDSGWRVPQAKANQKVYDKAVSSVKKMSDMELAKAIQKQNEAIYSEKKAQTGLMKNIARKWKEDIKPFNRDWASKQDRETKMKELAMARVVLINEKNRRAQERLKTVAEDLGMSPDPKTPGPEQGGPGPGRGPDSNYTGPMGEAVRSGIHLATVNGEKVADVQGARGTYGIKVHQGHENNDYYTMNFTPNGREGKPATELGMARDRNGLEVYIDQMDASVATGDGVSRRAAQLARQANGVSRKDNINADIDHILGSGMVDERLNAAVASQNLRAFAYPLKGGEMIWENKDGDWQAGSFKEFTREANRRADKDLMDAADVIAGEKKQRASENQNKTWLDVPPSEENKAMGKGAVFDPIEGRFYAPSEEAVKNTEQWQNRRAEEQMEYERGRMAADQIIDPANVDNPHIKGHQDPGELRNMASQQTVSNTEATSIKPDLNPDHQKAEIKQAASFSVGAEAAMAKKAHERSAQDWHAIYADKGPEDLTKAYEQARDQKYAAEADKAQNGRTGENTRQTIGLKNELLALGNVMKAKGIAIPHDSHADEAKKRQQSRGQGAGM